MRKYLRKPVLERKLLFWPIVQKTYISVEKSHQQWVETAGHIDALVRSRVMKPHAQLASPFLLQFGSPIHGKVAPTFRVLSVAQLIYVRMSLLTMCRSLFAFSLILDPVKLKINNIHQIKFLYNIWTSIIVDF